MKSTQLLKKRKVPWFPNAKSTEFEFPEQIPGRWAIKEESGERVCGSEGQKAPSDKRKVKTKEAFGLRPREGV